MHRKQLDKWIHGLHKKSYQPPKVFVISCSDLSQYLLAVEYKSKVEPVLLAGKPLHFSSLTEVREELKRLDVERAYLRMQNCYDECGCPDAPRYFDQELTLITH